MQSSNATFSFGAWLRMHLVESVVFIIILRCSFHIICKIIHMSRFSFQLLCPRLTRRVTPPTLARHKSQQNERPDRWKQKTLRIKHCFSMKTTQFLPLMWSSDVRAEATHVCWPSGDDLSWYCCCVPRYKDITTRYPRAPGTDINKYQGNAAGVGPGSWGHCCQDSLITISLWRLTVFYCRHDLLECHWDLPASNECLSCHLTWKIVQHFTALFIQKGCCCWMKV